MRHGTFEAPEHRSFLTQNVDVLYCNNFNGVFGERANSMSVTWCLNDYIGGLLTQLKPGAKLITLDQIRRLPPSLTEANETRVANGLPAHDEASFYTMDIVENDGGNDMLSFTSMPFKMYVYTRINRTASFLCCNPECNYNHDPIEAGMKVGQGDKERLVSAIDCPGCKQHMRPKRERVGTVRFEPS